MTTPGTPRKGDILAGKLQVEDVLGAGGMGVVVAARHLILKQRVAVKFLLPQAMSVPGAAARFVREAQAAVAIQSEHVARVLDVGSLPDGAPYMVMEFLAGSDLGKMLKRYGRPPVADAIDYVLQACEAIAEAHALGIVHRDLKPGNLFLTTRPDGSAFVKVLDFGLSKMAAGGDGAVEQSLTATGFVMGSPQYMSPEQIRSLKEADRRTDVWALGVILYELLGGRKPFDGASLPAISASIVLDTPPSLQALRPDVPPGLEAVVMGCLVKNPDARTGSVPDLAEALAPFAASRSLGSVERIVRLRATSTTVSLVTGPAADEAATITVPVAARPEVARPALPSHVPEPTSMSAPVPVPRAPFPSLPTAEPAMTAGAPVPPTTTASWGQTQPGMRRSPLPWIAGGVGLMAVTAAVVIVGAVRGGGGGDAVGATPVAVTETSSHATATAPAPATAPPAPVVTAAPAGTAATTSPAPVTSATSAVPVATTVPAGATAASATPAAKKPPKVMKPHSSLDNPN